LLAGEQWIDLARDVRACSCVSSDAHLQQSAGRASRAKSFGRSAKARRTPLKDLTLVAPIRSRPSVQRQQYRDHNAEDGQTPIQRPPPPKPGFFVQTAIGVAAPIRRSCSTSASPRDWICGLARHRDRGTNGPLHPKGGEHETRLTMCSVHIVNDVTGATGKCGRTAGGHDLGKSFGSGKALTQARRWPCIVTAGRNSGAQNPKGDVAHQRRTRQSSSTSNMIWTGRVTHPSFAPSAPTPFSPHAQCPAW